MADDIRIVIAEDHPFFRDGLRRALANGTSLTVVGEASDGESALSQIRALKPDVAILDIGLPRMNGFAVVRTVRQERIPVEAVFLTIHQDPDMFEEALALDVKGYLTKDCTEAELLRCIRAVSSGQYYTCPSMTTFLVSRTQRVERFVRHNAGLRLLTPQERAVLRLIAQGKTSKEIARQMGIAPKTVDAHRGNICHKLEIHGQHVLSRFAARHRMEI